MFAQHPGASSGWLLTPQASSLPEVCVNQVGEECSLHVSFPVLRMLVLLGKEMGKTLETAVSKQSIQQAPPQISSRLKPVSPLKAAVAQHQVPGVCEALRELWDSGKSVCVKQ